MSSFDIHALRRTTTFTSSSIAVPTKPCRANGNPECHRGFVRERCRKCTLGSIVCHMCYSAPSPSYLKPSTSALSPSLLSSSLALTTRSPCSGQYQDLVPISAPVSTASFNPSPTPQSACSPTSITFSSNIAVSTRINGAAANSSKMASPTGTTVAASPLVLPSSSSASPSSFLTPCIYCKNGRKACEECFGLGYVQRICQDCIRESHRRHSNNNHHNIISLRRGRSNEGYGVHTNSCNNNGSGSGDSGDEGTSRGRKRGYSRNNNNSAAYRRKASLPLPTSWNQMGEGWSKFKEQLLVSTTNMATATTAAMAKSILSTGGGGSGSVKGNDRGTVKGAQVSAAVQERKEQEQEQQPIDISPTIALASVSSGIGTSPGTDTDTATTIAQPRAPTTLTFSVPVPEALIEHSPSNQFPLPLQQQQEHKLLSYPEAKDFKEDDEIEVQTKDWIDGNGTSDAADATLHPEYGCDNSKVNSNGSGSRLSFKDTVKKHLKVPILFSNINKRSNQQSNVLNNASEVDGHNRRRQKKKKTKHHRRQWSLSLLAPSGLLRSMASSAA
ncbi:hypothetical protein BX616_010174 [Lobosporangium transversale]|nr:hypothetical protein BX616_010174 [Lobosporangium transversale]